MMERRAFPRDISPDAPEEELRAYLGDLLEWLALKKRLDLMQAGFTEPDLFTLRRVGAAYRTNTLTPEIMAKANALFAKLETLRM